MARGSNKQEKAIGINPKNVQAFDRLAFLHQASILMSTIHYDTTTQKTTTTTTTQSKQDKNNKKVIKKWQGDPPGTVLGPARYFNNNMKQITAKLVMRLDPSVKRTVCKRCETPLLPAITSTTRIQSKPVATAVTVCKVCKAKKRYTSQNPNYELFSARSDIVVGEKSDNDDQEKDKTEALDQDSKGAAVVKTDSDKPV